MRAVVQRVSLSRVTINGEETGRIDRGFLVLLGVMDGDTPEDCAYMVKKLSGLRVFEDAEDKMNLSLKDVGGQILLVSQFTLAGDARRGNRPSFSAAARPEAAEPLFELVRAGLMSGGIQVQTGRFRASMRVELINEGPVTILLDSRKEF